MKIALGVEYNGANYHGWQRQVEAQSVQQKVEYALSKVADEPISIFCAGRTDAKVHATGQVVHFETSKQRALSAWTMGVNSNIPNDISISWAKEVDDTFHARFSATARCYRYVIYNAPLRPAILNQIVTHIHTPLNAKKMESAAQALIGKHDFTSFRATQCQSHSPWRTLQHLTIEQRGPYIVIEVKANAFLHHMVRNIVGSLVKVGTDEEPEEWIAYLLTQKDRTEAGATAKPDGLYLIDVDYPEAFAIPKPVQLFI